MEVCVCRLESVVKKTHCISYFQGYKHTFDFQILVNQMTDTPNGLVSTIIGVSFGNSYSAIAFTNKVSFMGN